MQAIIKNLYRKNKIMNRMIRSVVNKINYPKASYFDVCKKRKEHDVWDYIDLSKDMKIFLKDTSTDGSYYGILPTLKKYAGINKVTNFYVEHGIYFGNLVKEDSISSIFDATITFSKHRKEIICKKSDKKVITVGPYIHYANDYYTEEQYSTIKRKLGKTLLFFPPHSVKYGQVSYNIQKIRERLSVYKKDYDTIMICLYFRDVNAGFADMFKDDNVVIVTAGHYFDLNFLSRLKSIIKLSDHTVSMAIGTHIGYCVYLNRPHEIINEDITCTRPNERNRVFNIITESDINTRGRNYFQEFSKDENVLLDAFFNGGDKIIKKQRDLCNLYWGFDEIKRTEELKKLLLNI